jgi:tetratricopeptide (TPR) repeat protein
VDDSRRLASCYDRLAQSYLDRKQLDKALEFYQKGEKLRRTLAERNPKDLPLRRDLAWSCGMYGKIAMELGKTQEALKLLQEGKDIYQGLADANPQHSADQEMLTWNMRLLAICNEQIAKSYLDRKQLDKSLEFYQKGEKLRRTVAERNPKDAQSQRDLAWSCG